MVRAVVPEEVSVTDCVAGVFRLTLPNETVVEPTVSAGPETLNCRANVSVAPPAAADKVAVCAAVTAATVALNPALSEPAATVTVAGTVTEALLLARFTAMPPAGAAAVSVTAQLSLPVPTMLSLSHETALSDAGLAVLPVLAPVPLSVMVDVPESELLTTVRSPAAEPAAVGRYCTVTV
jgi:hypothetical protein